MNITDPERRIVNAKIIDQMRPKSNIDTRNFTGSLLEKNIHASVFNWWHSLYMLIRYRKFRMLSVEERTVVSALGYSWFYSIDSENYYTFVLESSSITVCKNKTFIAFIYNDEYYSVYDGDKAKEMFKLLWPLLKPFIKKLLNFTPNRYY